MLAALLLAQALSTKDIAAACGVHPAAFDRITDIGRPPEMRNATAVVVGDVTLDADGSVRGIANESVSYAFRALFERIVRESTYLAAESGCIAFPSIATVRVTFKPYENRVVMLDDGDPERADAPGAKAACDREAVVRRPAILPPWDGMGALPKPLAATVRLTFANGTLTDAVLARSTGASDLDDLVFAFVKGSAFDGPRAKCVDVARTVTMTLRLR